MLKGSETVVVEMAWKTLTSGSIPMFKDIWGMEFATDETAAMITLLAQSTHIALYASQHWLLVKNHHSTNTDVHLSTQDCNKQGVSSYLPNPQ